MSTPKFTSLLDYWHVHTSKTQEQNMPDGTTKTYTGSMGPSGNPSGSDSEADFGAQRGLQNAGFSGTAIQVGTSSGTDVNFYNGKGIITTLSLDNFKKLGE